MSSDEIIDIEPVAETGITLFRTDDPVDVIAAATKVATPLADLIRKQGLATRISGRDHVRIEGWTLLGSMLGVFPVTVWTKECDDGWEARVEARTRAGEVVGAAEAMCTRKERTWANRDPYALRSMAQTRAASKAMRMPLGFIMSLAGFDPTPAEEMPHDPAMSSGSDLLDREAEMEHYAAGQKRQNATTATTLPQDAKKPSGTTKPKDPYALHKQAALRAIQQEYPEMSGDEAKTLALKHWPAAVEAAGEGASPEVVADRALALVRLEAPFT